MKKLTINTDSPNGIITEIEEPAISPFHQIQILKQNLANTDYQSIKHSEGEMSDAEFEPIKMERKTWREEINKLEKLIEEDKLNV